MGVMRVESAELGVKSNNDTTDMGRIRLTWVSKLSPLPSHLSPGLGVRGW
jgi:hypothetical protein